MDMREFDDELPWGCWLTIKPGSRGPVFVDENGREWRSVREAFWCGRLGMELHIGEPPNEILETIHTILACGARRPDDIRNLPVEFSGLMVSPPYALMLHWLVREGLMTPVRGYRIAADVTPEGVAVMLMLDATRPAPVRQMRADQASIDVLVELGRGPVRGEDRRHEIETAASRWDNAFLRRQTGRKSTIVLTKRGDGPMPVKETVWSLEFADRRIRDGFYDWLCDRLDRWPKWAEFASKHGSSGLTHHLLMMLAATLIDDGGPDGHGGDARLAIEHHG